VEQEERKRGRPAVWRDARARRRAHQQRQREKLRLIDGLLHAVRNAQWEDLDLQRRLLSGTDAEVLVALTEHYQERHWWRVQCREMTALPSPSGGEPMPPD